METYYNILEIHDSATPEEIKEAYRLLLQVWHPDRFHHRPKLLAKAEQKSGKINVAFETLSDPVLKQRYDEWLRACNGQSAKTVEPVTCPSCQTTFHSTPERNEKWNIHRQDRASATVQENETLPPARMAMVAIALIFAGIIVFTLTKSSKIIISNKPAQMDEKVTLPKTEPFALKEDHPVHQAVAARDGVSNRSAQAEERETPPRNAPTAKTRQERLNGLDAMQRQLAQAPGHAPASPTEMISTVDLQQLKTLGARGNASAQNQLGQLYANGRGVPQDYATAQGWYEKAAAQGHAWAQNQLGQLSADGLGAPQDYKKARQWWEHAATQGVAQAQYNLGQLYANGRGVPQDYATARGWYEKAAAQGNAWAQAQLALL